MPSRIIVIDNHTTSRESLTATLSSEGWQVSGFDYAGFSLAVLEQDRPNLIILNFNLPNVGVGWGLLQLLKMVDEVVNIPILIISTAFQVSTELRNYLFTRNIGTVRQPLDLDAFLTRVRTTLALASQSEVLLPDGRTLPVLVVEDSGDLRDALTVILELEGYRVVAVDNGLAALDQVYLANHSLILLDLAMPVMDGIAFLRAYSRQLRPHSRVVVLSAEETVNTDDLPTFVVEVLDKPFEIDDLLRVIVKYAQPDTTNAIDTSSDAHRSRGWP